ncbi:Hypothetical protein CINCED_3A023412 [Cinara cedri]|uniref:Uncharacterized protein n=1 Tax=Cinara cedri TaxID=506608 RepID=A0A5E4NG61_9HEMI|nr:Hypothetical protein CINCED_3A023412 [Cinara cedri]
MADRHNGATINENIKPAIEFNQEEKSAVCAIKAYVFMKNPPKGNFIGLKFANEARKLNPTEPEWICIWLLVKGRVRRYNVIKFSKQPDTCEIDAVEQLLSIENPKPRYLYPVFDVYNEVASYYFRRNPNCSIADKYYKLSIKIIKKALMLLDGINDNQLCYFTLIYIQIPDYKTAKRYFSRAMVVGGTFRCAITLFKVECLLQPTGQFPFVQTLNMIYDTFISPERRLIILCLILIYYHSCERNEQELMHYLKLYMDQDTDNDKKRLQLYTAKSCFKNIWFIKGQFLAELALYVENITNTYEWNSKEKQIVNDTYNRFIEMLKANNKEDSKNKDKTLQHSRVKELCWRTKQDESVKYENTSLNEVNNQEKNGSCKSSNKRNDLQSSNEDKILSWRNNKGDRVYRNEFQKTVTNNPSAGYSKSDEQNEGNGNWTENRTYTNNSIFGPRRNSKPISKFPSNSSR